MIQVSERSIAARSAGTRALSALEASSVAGAGYDLSVALYMGLAGAAFTNGSLTTNPTDPATIGPYQTFGRDGTGGYFVWFAPLSNSWGVWVDSAGHDDDS